MSLEMIVLIVTLVLLVGTTLYVGSLEKTIKSHTQMLGKVVEVLDHMATTDSLLEKRISSIQTSSTTPTSIMSSISKNGSKLRQSLKEQYGTEQEEACGDS